MTTVDDFVTRVRLRSLMPGAADSILSRTITSVVEMTSQTPLDLVHGSVVYVPSTTWPSLPSPEAIPSQLKLTGALAVVVNNDDLNLPPEFVEACVHAAIPVFLLPKSKTFDELRAALTQQANGIDPRAARPSDLDAIRNALDGFTADTGTQAWFVMQGGVVSSTPVDVAQLIKIVARNPTPLQQSMSAATTLNVDLPGSGHTLAIANPNRSALNLLRIDGLVREINTHTEAIEVKRSARRQIEAALIRELIEANVASATLDPWVESFDLAPGSRVRAIAAVLPDDMHAERETVGDALRDLGLLDSGICVASVYGNCAYALITLADGEFGSSDEITGFEHQLMVLADLFEFRHQQALSLGVSSCVLRGSDDLVRGLINARQLADRHARSAVAEMDAIPLAVPLAATLLSAEPELAAVLDRALLQPVIAYDRDKGTSYLESLRTFLALDCQWAATATELGIHINTLRYRLKRIERLTGRGLHTTADRSDYYLALCLRESPGSGQ